MNKPFSRRHPQLYLHTVLALIAGAGPVFILKNIGPFAIELFGMGVPVTRAAAPASLAAVIWLSGLAWPLWSRNKCFIASLVVFIVLGISFNEILLPRNLARETTENKNVRLKNSPAAENLIIISLDTLRADRVGTYGYSRNTTPNIDRFASRGAVFENTYTQSPATLPSHSTALTGVYPGAHGGQIMTYEPLPGSVLTLAEILKNNGFETASFNGGAQLSRFFGFDQGFDVFNDTGAGIRASWPSARKWLGERRDKRFFLFLHCYDIHTPYAPPHPFDKSFDRAYKGRLPDSIGLELVKDINSGKLKISDGDLKHINAMYDGGIKATDDYLKTIFDYLETSGLLANTAVVIMSDHGEELGDHGIVGLHAHSLYEEVLRVPLIIRAPGLKPSRISNRMRLIDLTPTSLDILGIPFRPKQFQGRSATHLLLSGRHAAARPRPVFAEKERESIAQEQQREKCIIIGEWKMTAPSVASPGAGLAAKLPFGIIYPLKGKRLFDLSCDPREKHNRILTDMPRARALEREILRIAGGNSKHMPDRDRHLPPPRKDIQKLKDLGYVK